MSKELQYRPEIDGLRAVAVIAVIVYHLNPTLMVGGFLGVDVFFVISGFLITTIIHRQIQEGRFSFWQFWKRRFKRLYPALAVVVASTLIVGLFVLPNPERAALPKQAFTALFSLSNMYLWHSTEGYWSSASENISLLHTWSLSLEEQFYICFPLLLFAAYKFCNRHTKKLVVCLFVASLTLCLFYTGQDRSAAFYFLPTRMWELLVGGLLAVYGLPTHRALRSATTATVLHLTGLALIVGSYFTIANNEYFPSYLPILTCLGTLLLLAVRNEKSLVTKALSTGGFVYIGKLSYSLYLWHWPLIVYAYYMSPDPNLFIVVAVTFGLAMLSYHFVEQPMRTADRLPRLPSFTAGGVMIACFSAFLLMPQSPLLDSLEGFDDPSAMSRGIEYEGTAKLKDATYTPGIGDTERTLVVIGSSHARVICKPVENFAKENGYAFESLTSSGYGISVDDYAQGQPTVALNDRRFALVEQIQPDILVIAGKWASEVLDKDGRETFKRRLQSASMCSHQVVVLGQIPRIDLPNAYIKMMRKYVVANHLSGKPIALRPAISVREANDTVMGVIDELGAHNIVFVDPTKLLTTVEGHVKVFNDGMFLYSDYHHINDNGAQLVFDRLLAPALRPKFNETAVSDLGAVIPSASHN